jgi:DNA-binding CsgD family transcriptional regulator
MKPFTPRETAVLNLVIEGYNTESIAANLEISEDTVKVHITRMCRKRGVNTRLDLVVGELKSRHEEELAIANKSQMYY